METLSFRELEVLTHISYGLKSCLIAKELYISHHTVLSHRKNLLTKLNAKNTAHLIRIAFEYNLLPLGNNSTDSQDPFQSSKLSIVSNNYNHKLAIRI